MNIGWAWWHRANNIKMNASENFDIDILKKGHAFDHNKYDFIILFEAYFTNFHDVPAEKIIVVQAH